MSDYTIRMLQELLKKSRSRAYSYGYIKCNTFNTNQLYSSNKFDSNIKIENKTQKQYQTHAETYKHRDKHKGKQKRRMIRCYITTHPE